MVTAGSAPGRHLGLDNASENEVVRFDIELDGHRASRVRRADPAAAAEVEAVSAIRLEGGNCIAGFGRSASPSLRT
jgi:hypothetical protein